MVLLRFSGHYEKEIHQLQKRNMSPLVSLHRKNSRYPVVYLRVFVRRKKNKSSGIFFMARWALPKTESQNLPICE